MDFRGSYSMPSATTNDARFPGEICFVCMRVMPDQITIAMPVDVMACITGEIIPVFLTICIPHLKIAESEWLNRSVWYFESYMS